MFARVFFLYFVVVVGLFACLLACLLAFVAVVVVVVVAFSSLSVDSRVVEKYLILLRHMPALFATSLIRNSCHKTAATTVTFLPFSNRNL